MTFNVQFTLNRYPLRNMHRALKEAESRLEDFLFPLNPVVVKKPNVTPNFINRDIGNNKEQAKAVSYKFHIKSCAKSLYSVCEFRFLNLQNFSFLELEKN